VLASAKTNNDDNNNNNQQAIEAIENIGRHISIITEDTFETAQLFQRISVAIQRGNAVSFVHEHF